MESTTVQNPDEMKEQNLTSEQKNAINYITTQYFEKTEGILSAADLSSQKILFKPSGDAGLNTRVSANYIGTEDDINLSFIRTACGSFSVVCEFPDDPLQKDILEHPAYESKLIDVLSMFCWDMHKNFQEEKNNALTRKILQGAAATKLLQDHQNVQVREILDIFSKRAHQSALFILQVPPVDLVERIGEDYSRTMEKQFSKIPKEWITHVLLPNPEEVMTDFHTETIGNQKVKFQFVGSKLFYPTINLGGSFGLKNVEVSCPNYEESLEYIYLTEIKDSKYKCLTHISRVEI